MRLAVGVRTESRHAAVANRNVAADDLETVVHRDDDAVSDQEGGHERWEVAVDAV
jgi:hypothetical protein